MDLKLVKNLLTLISESEVDEVSIEEGDFKIKIKKKSGSDQALNVQYPPFPQQQVLHPTAATGNTDAGQAPKKESAPPTGDTLKSPIVGTFYRASSPDSDPFVEVGTKVEKGDTICIIEAMKIMNEIEAESSGVIQEILVDNAQPVDFDQPLFIIKKD